MANDGPARTTNLLLTGPPGVGKTTAIRRTLGLLPEVTLGGFVTAAIEERGRRTGFSIRDLRGPVGLLASMDLPSGPKVSRYRVNVPDIERVGVPALLSALEEADLVVCDEIGRMELFCPAFCQAILRCLDAVKPVFGTLQARHNAFLDAIRARPDVGIVTVTLANRDTLPERLATTLRRLVGLR
jgi:nucleoside-triphosphatase